MHFERSTIGRFATGMMLALVVGLAPAARAEYRAPSLPELDKFSPVDKPAAAPAAPTLAGLPPDLMAKLKSNPQLMALVQQRLTQLNAAYGKSRPQAGPSPAALQAREDALESLRSKQMLDEELARVRQMLAATAPVVPVEEEAPAAAPVEPEPVVAPVSNEPPPPAPVGRLLSSVQSSERRREQLAARTAAIKENIARKDARTNSLSNSSGGTFFQASLEFNRSARGSTPSARANPYPNLQRQKMLQKELADADAIASGKTSLVARTSGSRPLGRDGTLGFQGDVAIRPKAVAQRETPEALLARHKFQSNGINDAAPNGTAKDAGDGRHASTYRSAAIVEGQSSPDAPAQSQGLVFMDFESK